MRAGVRGEEVLHAGSVPAAVVAGAIDVLRGDAAGSAFRGPDPEAAGAAGGRGGDVRGGGVVFHPAALQLRDSVPAAEVSAEPAEEQCDRVGEFRGACGALAAQLVGCVQAAAGGGGDRVDVECVVVAGGAWVVLLHRLRRMPEHVDWVFRRGVLGVVGVS